MTKYFIVVALIASVIVAGVMVWTGQWGWVMTTDPSWKLPPTRADLYVCALMVIIWARR